MSQPLAKINWIVFIKDSVVLIAHMLLSLFFVRVALMLNDYYQAPLLAAVAWVVALTFAIPLLLHFLDLWAGLLAAVREDTIAERFFKLSIKVHQKLFGSENAFMSEKEAQLANVYFVSGRSEEAVKQFEQSWEHYQNAKLKYPPLNLCFKNYLDLLNSEPEKLSNAEKISQLKSSLLASKNYLIAQKTASVLVTLPVVLFMLSTRALEDEIGRNNSDNKVVLALKGINTLASLETAILGNYAGARIFADYAHAFEESKSQTAEMIWCTDKALSALSKSKVQDDFMRLALLNLKAKEELERDKRDDARKILIEAIAISNGSGSGTSSGAGTSSSATQNNRSWLATYPARLETEKALLSLAEIERLDGNYSLAEPLYAKALGLNEQAQGIQGARDPGTAYRSYPGKIVDTIELIDRLHKVQHIESKLGKKEKVLDIQKRICALLDSTGHLQDLNNKSASNTQTEQDFGVRESARELDVCSLMLAEAGKDKEAKEYRDRAEALRDRFTRTLKLNASQQDSIVDVVTRMTNGLLAVKYRADFKSNDWHDALLSLQRNELKDRKVRGAFERLPWYDPDSLKTKKLQKPDERRRIEIEIIPLSIRNSPDGNGVAIDVQGVVKIYPRSTTASASPVARNQSKLQAQEPEEQKFGFVYLVKDEKSGRPRIDDFLDNQALANFQLD